MFYWEAFDYQPHRRGWVWYVLFTLVIFGSAAVALVFSPTNWPVSLALCVAGGAYAFAHRNGEKVHQVSVFENGIFIGQRFLPFSELEGYWFVYDQTAAIINFQFKSKRDKKISLQMGTNTPDMFREYFSVLDKLPELTDKKEGLVDLWTRALKL